MTSFPSQPIGDGDGLAGIRIIELDVLYDNDIVLDNQDLSRMLYEHLENKLGRLNALIDTMQRCRIVGYDTQEVSVSKQTMPRGLWRKKTRQCDNGKSYLVQP